jgi:16S rRNA (adenine1518-N6/adenine1519-N6)-dimethyltransferase
MNLASKKTIKGLLRNFQIRPSKKLGQNFLIDQKAVKKIIEAADLNPEDIVLEIGPGLGILTIELVKRAKKVVAVEKDPYFVRILNEELRIKNVELIQGDILKIKNLKLKIKNYKVVGNLPFYLTAPVIRKFLEIKCPPKEMILVVQKEVGQRICARPPKMSILAISVQFYAEAKIVSYVSKKSFWPQPEVDAAIIKITPKKPPTSPGLAGLFFQIVKAGFSHPRKQLINNLSTSLNLNKEKTAKWLLENRIQPARRAETLTVENWINLAKSFKF